MDADRRFRRGCSVLVMMMAGGMTVWTNDPVHADQVVARFRSSPTEVDFRAKNPPNYSSLTTPGIEFSPQSRPNQNPPSLRPLSSWNLLTVFTTTMIAAPPALHTIGVTTGTTAIPPSVVTPSPTVQNLVSTPGIPGTPGTPGYPGIPGSGGIPGIAFEPLTAEETPEPSTLALGLVGLGLIHLGRRKARARQIRADAES